MTSRIILLLIYYSIIMSTTIHPCHIETYIETLNIRDCLMTPIEIETTRCLGQCYSEDFLIYDWQSEPTFYRHKHQIHCCSPNMTIPHDIPIVCSNKQQRLIQYPFITRCNCKLCNDICDG